MKRLRERERERQMGDREREAEGMMLIPGTIIMWGEWFRYPLYGVGIEGSALGPATTSLVIS